MKCSVYCAASVDGFIARSDGGLDWLPENPEPHGYDEFIATVDAIVMGRNTLDVVLKYPGWHFTRPVIGLSSRPEEMKAPDGADFEAMSGTPPEIVARLAERGHEHLYIDGGITIQQFLEAGLIQRMIVTRIPVLIGSGIPLFGQLSRDIRLEHIATKTYPSGLVQSEYLMS